MQAECVAFFGVVFTALSLSRSLLFICLVCVYMHRAQAYYQLTSSSSTWMNSSNKIAFIYLRHLSYLRLVLEPSLVHECRLCRTRAVPFRRLRLWS